MLLSPLRRRAAFTLIELLVVIAIIAILAAILFPVFAQAREKARQTSCLSNGKQLGLGVMMYIQDYDEVFPTHYVYNVPTINGGTSTTVTWDQTLLPYLKNYNIFACPSDTNRPQPSTDFSFNDGNLQKQALRRSYQFPLPINTVQANGSDANTGLSGQALASVEQTSDTILLPEVWTSTSLSGNSSYVGSANSSVFTGCDTWKLAGRVVGSTAAQDQLPTGCSGVMSATYQPSKGHSNGANYVNADGSSKFRNWGAIRKNDFYVFKRSKPTTTYTP